MTELASSNETLRELVCVACDGALTESDVAQIEELLRGNREAQRFYLARIHLDAWMRWEFAHEPQAPPLPLCVSPVPTGFFAPPHSTLNCFSSGWPLAYLIAMVVVGIGLWIGSVTPAFYPQQIAKRSSLSSRVAPELATDLVGRITGMDDCNWADSQIAPTSNNIRLGQAYALNSGLMKITYDTGATVILQGPVAYVVESKNGGFMSSGRLTGKVSTATAKGFSVRTPAATVTDLGTEFGVEVDKDGNHDVQVFVGEVNVQLPPEHGNKPREIHLTENHAIRFRAASSTVTNHVAAPERFVRTMRQRLVSQSHVIGVNFTHGDHSNLSPDEQTGVVRAGCWNNVDGDPLPTTTVPPLHDAAGKETSARLFWQWSYSGADLSYRTYWNYQNKETPAVYPFEKLMDGLFNGVVERNTQTTARTPVSLTIGVSGVPYRRYRVYVYYSTWPATDDPNNPLMHTFGLSVNGSKPLIVSRPKFWLNDFYRYQSETRSGNYQVFENLTGDLTIRATPDGPGPLHDKFITGLQIVETTH